MAVTLRKRSWERRLFRVDFKDDLGGRAIASIDSVTAAGQVSGLGALTISDTSEDDRHVQFLARAGDAGGDYTVTLRILTDGTPVQRIEKAVKLEVRDTTP